MRQFLKATSKAITRFWNYTLGGEVLASGGAATFIQSTSGQLVTPETSLSLPDVYCAITTIACAGAGLTLDTVEQKGNKRVKHREHPAFQLMNITPDDETTAISFRQSLWFSALGYGNGYAEIIRNGAGKPVRLRLLTPNAVQPYRDEQKQLWYKVTPLAQDNTGTQIPLSEARNIPPRNMFHFRWIGKNGLLGLSPIAVARRSVSLGLAASEFASNYYENSTRPGGYFEQKVKHKPEALKEFAQQWRESYVGASNAGKSPILPAGLTWHQMPLISPEDAAWVEAMRLTPSQIAKIYRIGLDRLGEYADQKFTTPEQYDASFWTNCMMSPLLEFEQEANLKLYSPSERTAYSSRHDMSDRFRGDQKSQADYMTKAIGVGQSVNEIRIRCGLDPIDDEQADYNFVPAQLIPLQLIGSDLHVAIAKGDTKGKSVDDQESPQEDSGKTSPPAGQDANTNAVATPDNTVKQFAKSLFKEASDRLLRKEHAALRRHSKKPETFLDFLDEFYTKHRADSIDQLTHAYGLYKHVAECKTSLDELVDIKITETTKALLTLCGSSPDHTLEAKIDALCTKWESPSASYSRYVVSGLPASGKSEWVSQHKIQGDLLWDFDAIANAMNQGDYPRPSHTVSLMQELENKYLDFILANNPPCNVYIICSDAEKAKDISAKIFADHVHLEIDEEERQKRLQERKNR